MFVKAILASLLLATSSYAQEGKSYPDGRGGEVFFPLGDLSFADEVTGFTAGEPVAAPQNSIADEALGPPDYTNAVDDYYLTLGCAGVAIFRFTDNALAAIDGPDLYVFEIGPAVEPTHLSISGDGENWIDVGVISGATAEVDIDGLVGPGETFSYVRLVDQRADCSGEWPGADIDAVGTIGAGRRVVLDSAVLFEFDKAELKPEAEDVLRELVTEIAGMRNVRVVIEGHTDNLGSDSYNQELSEARAASVKDFMVGQGDLNLDAVESVGYGETRPAVGNDTVENQAKNRRVEILIITGS